ncbi:hypothetical protein [Streptomyces phaeochromogenes]
MWCRPESSSRMWTSCRCGDFEQALREGRVRVRFPGIGLDPLVWKPEILLVCVWDAEAFERIFTSMGQRNEEGVLGYASHKDTLPSGRACLAPAAGAGVERLGSLIRDGGTGGSGE